MNELKPCPRCGANGELKRANSYRTTSPAYGKYKVRCENSECLDHYIVRYFETEGQAAKAWNRRADNE